MKYDCCNTTWLVSSVRFFIQGRFQLFFQERRLSEGPGLLDDIVFKTGVPFFQEPGSSLCSKHQREVLQNLIKKGRTTITITKSSVFHKCFSNSHLLPTSPFVSKKRGNIWSMSADCCGSWSICWRQWNVSLIFWKTKSRSVVWWRRDMASIHSSPICWSAMEPNVLDDVGPPFSITLLWDADVVLDWRCTVLIRHSKSLCCSGCHRNVPEKKLKQYFWLECRQYQVFDDLVHAGCTQKSNKQKRNHHHYFTLWLQCKLTYPFFEYGSFKDGKSDTIPRAWNSFVALLTALLQKQKYCLW